MRSWVFWLIVAFITLEILFSTTRIVIDDATIFEHNALIEWGEW